MSTQRALGSFCQQNGTWLTTEQPLLEAGAFKQAFAPSPFVRCSDTPWTPFQRLVSAGMAALGSTGGLYPQSVQAPFDAEERLYMALPWDGTSG
jgi:hypothetical protein